MTSSKPKENRGSIHARFIPREELQGFSATDAAANCIDVDDFSVFELQ